MIQSLVAMICGLCSLIYIIRQQRIIQLQNEEIQRHRKSLALRDEQLNLYKSINYEQANQIGRLKEYVAMLQQKVDHNIEKAAPRLAPGKRQG